MSSGKSNLELTLTQIRKDHGPESILNLEEESHADENSISTGSVSLDAIPHARLIV